MNWFELWMLKRILRKTVRQGNHEEKITGMYRMIIAAAQDEFNEDNIPTLRAFLEECQKDAMDQKLWIKSSNNQDMTFIL